MRIAIVTFHKAHNCGAMLQAWALKKVLESLGHTVEFPDCNHTGVWRGRWWGRKIRSGQLSKWKGLIAVPLMDLMSIGIHEITCAHYRRFVTKFLSGRSCSSKEFKVKYDLVVFGSDQIWNARITKDDTDYFLGRTLPSGLRAITYAASFGDRVPDNIEQIRAALARFSAVSVREKLAVNAFGSKVDLVADPTLLLDRNVYLEIASNYHPKKPYLYVYALDVGSDQMKLAKALAKKLGLKLVYTPALSYSCYRKPLGVTYGLSPDRMVDYALNCTAMVAMSFHGTVFALHSHKPFILLRDSKDVESRPGSLLSQLGCLDRMISPSAPLDRMVELLKHKVHDDVYRRIEDLRRDSMSWLASAVNGEERCDFSVKKSSDFRRAMK